MWAPWTMDSWYTDVHVDKTSIHIKYNAKKSLKEIIEYFGYKNARGFREKYINPLLKENNLKQTIPDKPTSRNQKYITAK